jgi:hypothetical protein
MDQIEAQFNAAFRHWKIVLPSEDIENRRQGEIIQDGWMIKYLFGSDEKGEYLDYYAAHRMTDDRHIRIYADGTNENLPVFSPFMQHSYDPAERARFEAEYYAENKRINAMLEAKGFGMRGNEPGGVLMNWLLKTEKLD